MVWCGVTRREAVRCRGIPLRHIPTAVIANRMLQISFSPTIQLLVKHETWRTHV